MKTTTVSETPKEKYLYLEVLRIIACFFVIFNHTSYDGFFIFTQRDMGSLQFGVDLAASVCSKVAVPLFLAISGALLIARKDEPLKTILIKRVWRTIYILVIFSFLFYLIDVFRGKQVFNLLTFCKQLYESNWNGSYWYLYLYIAFLLSLPFLRALASGLENKYFYMMFLIVFLFEAIVPVVEFCLWQGEHSYNSNLKIGWLASGIVLFPCLGYFLQHRVEISKVKRLLPVLWIGTLAGIGISCCMCCYNYQVTGEFTERFHSSFVLLSCATLFVSFKYLFYKIKVPGGVNRILMSIGGCVFGIYLLHMIPLNKIPVFVKLWDVFRVNWHMGDMAAAFLYSFLVMFVSYIAVWILKKIPFVNKLL